MQAAGTQRPSPTPTSSTSERSPDPMRTLHDALNASDDGVYNTGMIISPVTGEYIFHPDETRGSAAASEELSGQADSLKELIGKFTLR